MWYVVRNFAKSVGIEKIAPHDLRRSCARSCHVAGGELEQILFLLGHVSVQSTERYLGSKQNIRDAVNGHIGIEPQSECSGCVVHAAVPSGAARVSSLELGGFVGRAADFTGLISEKAVRTEPRTGLPAIHYKCKG